MTTPTFLTADQIASALAPSLKQRGFRKRRLTWCKDLGDLTVLFHIQRSQWSRDVWYYVFGIAVNAFAKRRSPAVTKITFNTAATAAMTIRVSPRSRYSESLTHGKRAMAPFRCCANT